MKRIKVFISGVGTTQLDADRLTKNCDEWLDENPNVNIESFHTNSNNHAWSLTVLYSIVSNKSVL